MHLHVLMRPGSGQAAQLIAPCNPCGTAACTAACGPQHAPPRRPRAPAQPLSTPAGHVVRRTACDGTYVLWDVRKLRPSVGWKALPVMEGATQNLLLSSHTPTVHVAALFCCCFPVGSARTAASSSNTEQFQQRVSERSMERKRVSGGLLHARRGGAVMTNASQSVLRAQCCIPDPRSASYTKQEQLLHNVIPHPPTRHPPGTGSSPCRMRVSMMLSFFFTRLYRMPSGSGREAQPACIQQLVVVLSVRPCWDQTNVRAPNSFPHLRPPSPCG